MNDAAHVRLARWIEWKGWTQEQAARELGCHQGTISKIISGQRKPGRDLADRIEKRSRRATTGCIRSSDWTSQPVVVAA